MARSKGFNASVDFDATSLLTQVKEHDQKVKRLIGSEFIYAEGESVDFAKSHAPWMDQSGNARAGLHAKANPVNGGQAFELVLAHSVPYGIWLEVRFSGKYAIIMPTLNIIGNLMIQRIAERLATV